MDLTFTFMDFPCPAEAVQYNDGHDESFRR